MNDTATIDRDQAAPETPGREPVLRVVNGSKIYGGVHAIEDVNFDLYAGEVHALAGENGAGKSTLCKAIAGAIHLTSGEMYVDGKPVDFDQPRDALAAGIAMVYQETSLVPTMTAAQNIELGNEKLLTRFRTLNIQAQQLLQSLNFHVDPATPVGLLGTAKKQMVEIARAIYNKARIIIFDEPTASLTPEEIVHFFHLVRDLRARGVGIIYISHALEESLQIADRITVLRDGKLVITEAAKNLTRAALVQHMVGREVAQSVYGGKRNTGNARRERVLTVENVTMGMAVKNMSFSVYAGEVVGIAGLIGSGRTEIAKVIFGALKRNLINGGTIKLRGKPVRYRVPRQAIDDGIAYITEDRKLNGFFETMIVDDNVYIGNLATRKGWSFLAVARAAQQARELLGGAAEDQRPSAQGKNHRTVGRQPAEGRAGQDDGAGAFDHHLRRADPRRRRRHHSAHPRRDPPPGRRRQGDRGDLILPAGDPGGVRPHPRGADGAHRRRVRRSRRNAGQDPVRGDSLKDG